MDDEKRKQALKYFFDLQGRGLECCHDPVGACSEPGIRAHSIPSKLVLAQLERNRHVVMPKLTLGSTRASVAEFAEVGINNATTFTGLCANHDGTIFRPVDVAPPDCTNPEHLFLMAYRAVLREYHVVLTAALRNQANYLRQIELGLAPPDGPSDLGMIATAWIINAFDSYEYKRLYDEALIAKRWSDLDHRVIELDDQAPAVAVSSMFSLDHIEADETPRLTLTVAPRSGATDVVFSALPRDAGHAFRYIDPILQNRDHFQKYLLSKLVLQSCDNFVLAPAHFDQWPDKKKTIIRDYFVRTIHYNDEDFDDAELYLF